MTIRTSRHQLRLLLLFQSSLFRTFLTCKGSYVLLFCVLAHCLTQGQRTQKSTSMERTQTSTSTRPMMGLHPEEQPPEELQEQVPKRQLMNSWYNNNSSSWYNNYSSIWYNNYNSRRNLTKRKLPKRKIPKRKPPKRKIPKGRLPKRKNPKRKITKRKITKRKLPKRDLPRQDPERQLPKRNFHIMLNNLIDLLLIIRSTLHYGQCKMLLC